MGRTLHLVDADNLLGDPRTIDREYIEAVFAEYRSASGFKEGDQVVVATGCNGLHVFEVEAAWPAASHRRRSGPDGADLALLEEADWAATCRRFDRVVIGSGDRIFMVAFDALRAADIEVDVVARRGSAAKCLALRARGHIVELATIRPNVISALRRPIKRPSDYGRSRSGNRQPMRLFVGMDRYAELMAVV